MKLSIAGYQAVELALMATPLAILIVLASLYVQFSALPNVRAALQGFRVGRWGLVIDTAAKMAMNLRLSPVSLFFSLVALVAVSAAEGDKR